MRPGFLLVALLVGCPRSLAAAPAGDPAALWRWAATAVGRLVEGDTAGAFAALSRARAAQPLPEVDALAGLAALQGGELRAAERRLRDAAGRRSEQATVYYWAGRVELLAGRTEAALKRMEQALAVGGDQPALRLGHALVLLEAHQPEPAASSLLAAVAESPNLLDPSLFPSPVEGAVELLGSVFRGFPSRAKLLRTQGHLFWEAGRVTAAQRRFRELLSLDREDADALQMLARTELALGEEQQAAASLDRALRLAPDLPQARAARGELLLARGQAAAAVTELRHAADALPRDGRLLTRLGEACVAAERPDCARRFFSYAVLRDARLAAAHFGLGLLEQQAGQASKARQHFGQAVALEPWVSRYYEAAAQLEATADHSAARRWLAEARRAASFERDHHRHLDAAKKEARLQAAALRELAAAPRCQTRSCLTAVARLSEAPRAFMQAHLASKRGDRRRALELLRTLLPRLHARTLLLRDPSLVETAGQTVAGRRYQLRSSAPLVPTTRFR